MKHIAVVGGTGLLGKAVVRALHRKKSLFNITVISRTETPSENVIPGIKYITIKNYTDTEDSPLVLALQGQDVLVSMLGGPVAPTVDPILLSAAIKAKVHRFMPSEYTLDVTHPSARAVGAGNLIGARASFADRISEIAKSGVIEHTTLVVGGFLDLGIRTGLLGFDIVTRTATLYDDGVKKSCGSSVAFVADAVVTVLLMPEDETRNRRVQAVELKYSGEEVLAALEEEMGFKWHVNHISTDELKRRGARALGEGKKPEAYLDFVVKLNFDGEGAAQLDDGLEFGDGFELTRRSLSDIVKQVVEDVSGGKIGSMD